MNAIAKQFGVQHMMMPLHKARCVVMREHSTIGTVVTDVISDDMLCSRMMMMKKKKKNRPSKHPCHVVWKALRDNVDPYDYDCDSDTEDDDDEHDYLEEEEETSCSSESSVSDDDDETLSLHHHQHHPHYDAPQERPRRVRFSTPLVTASYVRPVTTLHEKYELYYTEREYREFRRNYVWHARNQPPQLPLTAHRKPSVVQFHIDVITAVHTTPIILDNPSELYYSKCELQGFLDDFVASLSKGV